MKKLFYFTRLTYGNNVDKWFEPLLLSIIIFSGILFTKDLEFIAFITLAFLLGRSLSFAENREHRKTAKSCFKTSVWLFFLPIVLYWSLPSVLIAIFMFFTGYDLSNKIGTKSHIKNIFSRMFFKDLSELDYEFVTCEKCGTKISQQVGVQRISKWDEELHSVMLLKCKNNKCKHENYFTFEK